MFERTVIAFGESDCENIGSGLLAQPVNAVSSLAFSVFGAAVLLTLARGKGAERTNRLIFGLLMVSTGIGSVLFHGPQGEISHFLHDVTFILTVLAIALMNTRSILGWTSRSMIIVLLGSGAAVSAVLIVWPSSTNILAIISVLAIVVSDLVLYRSGATRTRSWVVSVTIMLVAVAFFILGRTGGPLCDSVSLFQGHGLWHVLSAASLWLYFEATGAARTGPKT